MTVASDYFPVHAHSEFSWLDGMGSVPEMVAKVVSLGQPALALTDHGVMSGAIRLYKECRKQGIEPFPGSELYVVNSVDDPDGKKQRYHMGMLALDEQGWRAMVKLSSRSMHRDRFHKKPLVDFSDFAAMAESGAAQHVAVTTGCYFGLVQQALVTRGPAAMLSMIQMLHGWFPNLFVEIQNHGIDNHEGDYSTDQDITDELVGAASRLGLPVVAGQDSHYRDAKHQDVHDLMKNICYFGEGEDFQFPGGPFHLASTKWLKKQYALSQWDRIEEGHAALLDMHRLRLPALEKFKFHVPQVSTTPELDVLQLAEAKAQEMGVQTDPRYQERARHELNVIKQMGFANYFILTYRFTQYCRNNGVVVNARGSANGSLICFLLGITNIDPIVWDTDFDRFLSLDRQKPPDIDFDIASEDRAKAIAWLLSQFPTMVNIGTYSRMGITEQTDEMSGEGEDKGSLFVQYQAAMRRKPNFTGVITQEHRKLLNEMADIRIRKAPGVHAAGFVLPGEGLAIDDYLATMLIPSSGTTATQAVMEDVEDAGYVKLDMLGVRVLSSLGRCLGLLGKGPLEWDWIPWDDKKTFTVLRSNRGMGIFQFEGYTTAKGGKQMGVKTIHDVIACLALFRPAMMNSGMTDKYLANRQANITPLLHPLVDSLLAKTHGVPVYQEQVIGIMRAAGLNFQDLNDVIKAVKASNDKITEYAEKTFKRVEPIFIKAAQEKGCTQDDAERLWAVIMEFSDYGFNKAHATSYGHMAYRSAYLKTHHPLEFMTATLDVWAGSGKESLYVKEARRLGIMIGRASVNTSGVSWAIDRTKKEMVIRRGLLSIPKVGTGAAEAIIYNRPRGGYTSMEQLIDLNPARPVTGGKSWGKDKTLVGVLAALKDAGALVCLGVQQ